MSALPSCPEPDRAIGQFIAIHTRGVIAILSAKGFDVSWRFTREGSPRFRVDGKPSREMTAHEMSERFQASL